MNMNSSANQSAATNPDQSVPCEQGDSSTGLRIAMLLDREGLT